MERSVAQIRRPTTKPSITEASFRAGHRLKNYGLHRGKMNNTEFNTTKTPLILAAAGAAGGVLGFILGEIQSTDEVYRFFPESLNGATAVWFALVLLGIGSVLAASQGLGEGNTQKAFDTALRAAPAFIAGGAISGFIAQSVYTSMLDLVALEEAARQCPYDYSCSAVDSVIRPARAVGWMVAGGMGGIALGAGFRSAKRAQNGLFGGLAGGLIGGLFFDSIDNITGISTEGSSRFFAIVLILLQLACYFFNCFTAFSGYIFR